MSAQIKEKLVEFIDVSYEYMPGSVFSTIALNKINISIDYGEFIGIIGHTGSGKTTLVEKFVSDTFKEDFKSTIGVNLMKKTILMYLEPS